MFSKVKKPKKIKKLGKLKVHHTKGLFDYLSSTEKLQALNTASNEIRHLSMLLRDDTITSKQLVTEILPISSLIFEVIRRDYYIDIASKPEVDGGGYNFHEELTLYDKLKENRDVYIDLKSNEK